MYTNNLQTNSLQKFSFGFTALPAKGSTASTVLGMSGPLTASSSQMPSVMHPTLRAERSNCFSTSPLFAANDDASEPNPVDQRLSYAADRIQSRHSHGQFGIDRDYSVSQDSLQSLSGDCLVLPVQGNSAAEALTQLNEKLDMGLDQLVSAGAYPKRSGESRLVPLTSHAPFKQVLMVNVGDNHANQEIAESLAAKSIGSAFKSLQNSSCESATVLLSALTDATSGQSTLLSNVIARIEDRLYQITEYKSQHVEPSKLTSVTMHVAEDAQPLNQDQQRHLNEEVRIGKALARGLAHTKDLANMPANDCTPTFLADNAIGLSHSGDIKTTILEESDLKALGMNAFLSVSNGSVEPAKMILMSYQGADPQEKPIVIIGKGITFDSGGLNLKPTSGMGTMKYDMGGAASVVGTMNAIDQLKPKMNVIGIVAAAENMPSGTATRPSDIVTTMSGKTVEIDNTDAEGRLVLCDAITYAQQKLDPKVIIDVATLTGSCLHALGRVPSGLFTNNEALRSALEEAGQSRHDRVWSLPLWEDYDAYLKSDIADTRNTGSAGGSVGAGAITAARYLQGFVENDLPYAHLDIAGTATNPGASEAMNPMATGRPVPLLVQYLLNQEGGASSDQ